MTIYNYYLFTYVIFIVVYRFKHVSGDHFTLLTAYNRYKQENNDSEWCRDNFLNYRALKSADDIRSQLTKILNKLNVKVPVSCDYKTEMKQKRIQNITKCIVSGYFAQVAHLEPMGFYRTVRDNNIVFIHPSSVIEKPKWTVYHEFVLTNKNYIRTLCIVDPKYLFEIARKIKLYFYIAGYYDLEEMEKSNIKQDLLKVKEEVDKEQMDSDELEEYQMKTAPKMDVNIVYNKNYKK